MTGSPRTDAVPEAVREQHDRNRIASDPSPADRSDPPDPERATPQYVRPARAASRAELGAFLRSRRERITPDQVGLPVGRRRRTPGLRREEVAQLAGVGVTWYTWLEQGRPINASAQVIAGIARTLRLDAVELEHVKRLACIPSTATLRAENAVDADTRVLLDDFATLPAVVMNGRYDVLAYNELYARVFPAMVACPRGRRNLIWELFTRPKCCNPFHEWLQECQGVVGVLRGTYARNIGDPVWDAFIDELVETSPEFAKAWAAHPISLTRSRVKFFRHLDVGVLHVRGIPTDLAASPGQRLTVYVPQDEETRERLARLTAPDFVPSAPHTHGGV
ncbi:helix-turn-helix transcriptional regulator [Embleya scabrispora]|uniref:helix-turn-helix transcriptional regulator n=1 Tax=Embleya scabrispora TaxID=159449 RepID=UPI0003683901|nr:helix-turn-helix transcriptional regulator [Embleya scabrispora]MYS84635.1 helix-turn-helix domain-containing protein [Streptomyces sp. SID5474]